MSKYRVVLTAYAFQKGSVVVEADSADHAQTKALDLVSDCELDVDWSTMSSGEDPMVDSVERLEDDE